MSWHDRKTFEVTAAHLTLPWSGHRDGRNFRCALCGHFFEVGDKARWIFTNDGKKDAPSGNPFVCDPCDGPEEDVRARLKAHTDEGLKRFWWGARPEWDKATFIKIYGNPESPRKK